MKRAGLALVALAFVAGGCQDSGGGGTEAAPTSATGTELGETDTTGTVTTPTTSTVVAPPPVTHRQFVRRLDHICRVFNRKIDRFNKRNADVFASGDYEDVANALALTKRRLDPPWNRQLARLEVPPKDERSFRRYRALTQRLDELERRRIRALRRHDDDEIGRIVGLSDRARDQRTNVAIDMGLHVCGG
jgi:hypothetical protein